MWVLDAAAGRASAAALVLLIAVYGRPCRHLTHDHRLKDRSTHSNLPAVASASCRRRVQTLEAPGDAGQAVTAFGGAELEKHLGTLEASA